MFLLSEVSAGMSAMFPPSSNSSTPGHSTTGGRVVDVPSVVDVVELEVTVEPVPAPVQPAIRTSRVSTTTRLIPEEYDQPLKTIRLG